jgi:hypothetical protein
MKNSINNTKINKSKFASINKDLLGTINPIISYKNADTNKLEVLKANKKKSGIYC